MIVVVGLPAYADSPDGEKCAGGLVVEVAAAARRRGAQVELVGKVGNDGAGDAVVVSLGRLGIGHAALLRDPVRPTPVLVADASNDVEVDEDAPAALTFLRDAFGFEETFRLAMKDGRIGHAQVNLGESVLFLAFAGARLIVLLPAGSPPPPVPAEATVLEAPLDDDGSFGRMVGVFAGALDAGLDPAAAFNEAVSASGWEPVPD